MLRVRGVASLLEAITLGERLPGRVLAAVDGERRLTDLRHVAQLLHAVAMDEQLGTTALAGWLRSRIADAATDTADEERSRRLESDAEAVQVLTIHRSKGLEFPIVYAPFVWDPTWIRDEREPVAYHDPDAGNQRMIDVGLEGEEYEAHRKRSVLDERGEDLRLAYVALTRAKHQAVIWWAGTWDARNGALGRLCFARDEDGDVQAYADAVPDDATVRRRFDAIALAAPGCVSVEDADPGRRCAGSLPRAATRRCRPRPSTAAWTSPGAAPRTATSPRARTRRAWRASRSRAGWRTSPTTASRCPDRRRKRPTPRSRPSRRCWATCRPAPAWGPSCTGSSRPPTSPRPTCAPSWTRACARRWPGAAVDVGPIEAVVDGLRAAIATPLGPLAGGARLRDLARGDRLDELEFELPLAGGDDPTATVALGAIAAVLRAHLPAGDPLAALSPTGLEDPALRAEVRGYLTGSIDLVARLRGEAAPRFAIVDYKTNRLGAAGRAADRMALPPRRPRRGDGARALRAAGAALHRRAAPLPALAPAGLRARPPPGGVLYLFVRGMVGPDTPAVDGVPCGVFAWRPPAALVEALSDALDAAA